MQVREHHGVSRQPGYVIQPAACHAAASNRFGSRHDRIVFKGLDDADDRPLLIQQRNRPDVYRNPVSRFVVDKAHRLPPLWHRGGL